MNYTATMLDVERLLIHNLEESRDDILGAAYPEDELHEHVDSAVPTQNAILLEVAASSPSVAVDEPELGPAFDGRPTPINIIAANIYERLSVVAHEWLSEALEAAEQV